MFGAIDRNFPFEFAVFGAMVVVVWLGTWSGGFVVLFGFPLVVRQDRRELAACGQDRRELAAASSPGGRLFGFARRLVRCPLCPVARRGSSSAVEK